MSKPSRRAMLLGSVQLGLLGLSAISLSGCDKLGHGHTTDDELTPLPSDERSYANPMEARIRHADIDLFVDFAQRRLKGTVTLTLKSTPNAKHLILDVDQLEIFSVTDAAGSELKFSLEVLDEEDGAPETPPINQAQALRIDLPQGAQIVTIRYQTTLHNGPLQWFSSHQTHDKIYPFVYTHKRHGSIRSWLPTQDQMGIKHSFKARLSVPSPLMAIMSAPSLTPKGEAVSGNSGLTAYSFESPQPVCAQNISFCIGHFDYVELSSHLGLYGEKSLINQAATQFDAADKWLEASQKLLGATGPGQTYLVIMPPYFAYNALGGKGLCLISPSCLGDKPSANLALSSAIIDGLMSDISPKSDADNWFNLGVSTYLVNRACDVVLGAETAILWRDLDYIRLKEILKTIKPELSALNFANDRLNNPYIDPIKAGKGSGLFYLLEAKCGRKRLDAYFATLNTRLNLSPVTTKLCLEDISEHLTHHDPLLESSLDLATWINGLGLPDNFPAPDLEALKPVDEKRRAFSAGAKPDALGIASLSSIEKIYFLNTLPANLKLERLKDIETILAITKTSDLALQSAWFSLAIAHHYEPAMPHLRAFLLEQGRIDLIIPLYTALMQPKNNDTKLAKSAWAMARSSYSPDVNAALSTLVY